jgi:hypothetical protein
VHGASGRELVHDHAAISVDHGEQVVEVVRDSSGEPSDAFQPLRLLELF